jgi:PHD/YefM family antitoxin component YafN of YafNO toxin-antitoxin module
MAKSRMPEIVYREGEPVAVILDIEEYHEMLERLEDIEALAALAEMRKRPLELRTLEEFLEDYTPSA